MYAHITTNSIELRTTLERLPVVKPLDSFPEFYGTRRFNTEFTRASDYVPSLTLETKFRTHTEPHIKL
jgi:hypothetical protein